MFQVLCLYNDDRWLPKQQLVTKSKYYKNSNWSVGNDATSPEHILWSWSRKSANILLVTSLSYLYYKKAFCTLLCILKQL